MAAPNIPINKVPYECSISWICIMASFGFDDVVLYGWCFGANDFVLVVDKLFWHDILYPTSKGLIFWHNLVDAGHGGWIERQAREA